MKIAAAAGGGVWSVLLEARRRREELEQSRLDGSTFNESAKTRVRAVYRSWSRSWDKCWVRGGEESRARGIQVLACWGFGWSRSPLAPSPEPLFLQSELEFLTELMAEGTQKC